MNEEKLIKLLEKKFVIKNEFNDFCYEMRDFRKENLTELKAINEKLDDVKASANTLDEILVQYPIERISRLEKHSKLPKFKPDVSL